MIYYDAKVICDSYIVMFNFWDTLGLFLFLYLCKIIPKAYYCVGICNQQNILSCMIICVYMKIICSISHFYSFYRITHRLLSFSLRYLHIPQLMKNGLLGLYYTSNLCLVKYGMFAQIFSRPSAIFTSWHKYFAPYSWLKCIFFSFCCRIKVL